MEKELDEFELFLFIPIAVLQTLALTGVESNHALDLLRLAARHGRWGIVPDPPTCVHSEDCAKIP